MPMARDHAYTLSAKRVIVVRVIDYLDVSSSYLKYKPKWLGRQELLGNRGIGRKTG